MTDYDPKVHDNGWDNLGELWDFCDLMYINQIVEDRHKLLKDLTDQYWKQWRLKNEVRDSTVRIHDSGSVGNSLVVTYSHGHRSSFRYIRVVRQNTRNDGEEE